MDIHISVVDDDPDITLTLKTGLEPNGLLQVDTFNDPELALDTFNDPELALSSFKPDVYDLALLDLRMPKMYGHELYDEMKKRWQA
jgi:two-component system, OmpR family, response regulator ChvI